MQNHTKMIQKSRCFLALFFASVWMLWLSIPAQAGTIQVDGTNCTLSEAITSANSDSVGATGCTFDGTPGDDLLVLNPGATYVLGSSVASGTGTPTVVTTITISGTNTIVTRDTSFTCASNLFRLFRVAIGGDLTLHGLTLQNGCINDHGGAIYVTGGKLTLSDSIVQYSRAMESGNDGGALYIRPNAGNPGSVTLQNSTIYSNTADDLAGAIFVNGNASAMLTNSSIISNTSTNKAGGLFINGNGLALVNESVILGNIAMGQGGGFYNEDNARLVITSTQIIANEATGNGGGLVNDIGASLQITGSQIIANSTSSDGGGVHSNGRGAGTLVITNTLILSNTAAQGGGVMNDQFTTIKLDNVQIEANRASNGGGAIFNNVSANIVATNTNFISNKAAIGAGIFNNRGSVNLTNSWLIGGETASNGGGIFNNGRDVTLTNSYVVSNTAGGGGGGLFNNTTSGVTGTMTIIGSYVLSNTATGNGGGIAGANTSTLTISDTQIISNSAGGSGGGLYVIEGGTLTIKNSLVRANEAINGGGVFNDQGNTTHIHDSQILSNTAATGGGLYNGHQLFLNNTSLFSNTVTQNGGGLFNTSAATSTIVSSYFSEGFSHGNGGGIFNNGGQLTLTDTDVLTNVAMSGGGGLFNNKFDGNVGRIWIWGGSLLANSANQGGGLLNSGGEFDIANTAINYNEATTTGGGAHNSDGGLLAITNTQMILNQAGTNMAGGALADEASTSSIYQSCIVGNSSIAVHANNSLTTLTAMQNWWGAPDGPSGFGPGNGDDVGGGVDFANFLNSSILDCPTFAVALAVAKSVEPTGDLFPGQPLTYTITVTNNYMLQILDLQSIDGSRDAYNITLAEIVPAEVEITDIVTAGLEYEGNNNTGQLLPLAANQSASLVLRGRAVVTPTANQLITNSVVISHVLLPVTLSATVNNNLVLPAVAWSTASYTTTESSGNFTATLLIQPPNPHATITLQITIGGVAQEVNIAPGSASWPVVISITDDQTVEDDEIVALEIVGAEGALAGAPGSATLTIQDDDVAGVQIEPQSLTIQGFDGSGTLTVTLTSAPTDTVAVNFTPDSAFCTVTPNPLVLDNITWNVGITVTVSATNTIPDSGVVECDLAVTMSSSDPIYHEQFAQTVEVDILTGDVLGLAVSKIANVAQAQVGQEIIYTYTITNTGDAPLVSINALDDKLGEVAALAGGLGSGESRNATVSYTVQESDLPGPLVNSVVVTGENATSATITVSATFSVALSTSTLSWSAISYTTTEGSGDFAANLVIQPPNPHTTITVQIGVDANVASTLYNYMLQISDLQSIDGAVGTADVLEIAIPPGNNTWPVFITIADDQIASGNRTLLLTLLGAMNATVGVSNTALLTVEENDSAGLLIEPISLTIDGAAGSGNLTITLTSEPTSAVTVTVTPGNDFCIVIPNPVVLDSANWNIGVTLTVSATNSTPNSGEVECDLTINIESDDPVYNGQFLQIVEVNILTEDTDSLQMGLAVSKTASPTQAAVGEIITYSYRLTNTGEVDLVNIHALDDKLGNVAALAEGLAVGASSSVTISYTVQQSDLPGPLVNIVTVTAQNANDSTAPNATLTISATASVELTVPTGLPSEEQPQQGNWLYLPRMHR